jgi:hypothetical protein
LLAHGRWFSPGTSASSTTKTGRHDIVEILLKVALNTKNQNHIVVNSITHHPFVYSWESVHSGFKQNGLSNVLGLMDLLHSLPPTSILNETSFNQMKLIKTDRRHRLSFCSLTSFSDPWEKPENNKFD